MSAFGGKADMACFLPIDWADEARITLAMMVVRSSLPLQANDIFDYVICI
jgi:hypothetical protein